MRSVGPVRYLAFVLLMLGPPLSLLLNPLMWTATILYIVSRLDRLPAISAFIEGLFPAPVFPGPPRPGRGHLARAVMPAANHPAV